MTLSSTVIPIPEPLKSRSSAYALKERLNWGEPALTILDVRTRDEYNQCRITGSLSTPLEQIPSRVPAHLDNSRDIYVYGETDEQTALAASQLRDAGFQNVSELTGGLAGWKVVEGPIEGATPSAN